MTSTGDRSANPLVLGTYFHRGPHILKWWMGHITDFSEDLRSTNMTDHKISQYRHTRLYILDEKDPAQSQGSILGILNTTPHDQKLKYISALFETYFKDVEINHKYYSEEATEEDFNGYWEEQLNRCTGEELLIIYFHGSAGNQETRYSWKFENPPNHSWINAYKFIQKIDESAADALFLLDCWIQTRMTHRWTHRHDFTNTSTTEILAAPAALQDPDGKRLRDPRDFTEAVVGNLDCYVKLLQSPAGESHRALRTLPQILANDAFMYSSPIRIWLERPRKRRGRARRQIKRFVVDPQLVRLTGYFEFFAREIQEGE